MAAADRHTNAHVPKDTDAPGLRVAVVGATGNVGSAVVRALGEEASVSSILGLARRVPDWTPKKVEACALENLVSLSAWARMPRTQAACLSGTADPPADSASTGVMGPVSLRTCTGVPVSADSSTASITSST